MERAKLVLAALFLLCLFDMSYGFYQFVRSLGLIIFLLLSYDAYKKDEINYAIFYGASALIINPVFKVALGRTMWNVMDIMWVIILTYSIYKERKT